MSATAQPPSEAVQHYLRVVYRLEEEGSRATTNSVAEAMRVSPASASAMLKRLAAIGLVDHAPYRGVRLTAAGRRAALGLIRHHRLLEQYLAETLGVPLDQVHEEADRLEHVLSDELAGRIDALLGHPTHDPHGHPIPDAALDVAETGGRTLLHLEPGERATVGHVPDDEPAFLRYLADRGLLPGRPLELIVRDVLGGTVTVRVGGQDCTISSETAGHIGLA